MLLNNGRMADVYIVMTITLGHLYNPYLLLISIFSIDESQSIQLTMKYYSKLLLNL